MDIRSITPDFAVSPQIRVDDIETLKAEGFTHVICNRPVHENIPGEEPETLRQAVEAAGLSFAENPVTAGQLTLENIEAQSTSGKTLAYCASGTRSAIVWALAQAGKMPTPDILTAIAQAGFPMDQLGPQIDALASRAAQS
ncbi:MAG: TIGR01244 family phosphatase [Litoreibacter sp.]|nr:TIGR01244 family phosphatase [Litoreibacter sp.]